MLNITFISWVHWIKFILNMSLFEFGWSAFVSLVEKENYFPKHSAWQSALLIRNYHPSISPIFWWKVAMKTSFFWYCGKLCTVYKLQLLLEQTKTGIWRIGILIRPILSESYHSRKWCYHDSSNMDRIFITQQWTCVEKGPRGAKHSCRQGQTWMNLM